jgi:hypothetical protein
VEVEGAGFKIKLVAPGDHMFLQVDMIRKRGQKDVPQGVLNVLGIEFQLTENFLQCSGDPIMSTCLKKHFDDKFGTTDVYNITKKHLEIENTKIRGKEFFRDSVCFIRN